ncbi:serine-rich adhesin for platelets-like [Panonychus citri]|uniref:serine-rich adhesin for platelets-like n=1 Tax=Panonychus citri TaxID=50023 RepID=UPI0023070D63|nr:serine-rich adhesin for platelets-like [Panonychus citri]
MKNLPTLIAIATLAIALSISVDANTVKRSYPNSNGMFGMSMKFPNWFGKKPSSKVASSSDSSAQSSSQSSSSTSSSTDSDTNNKSTSNGALSSSDDGTGSSSSTGSSAAAASSSNTGSGSSAQTSKSGTGSGSGSGSSAASTAAASGASGASGSSGSGSSGSASDSSSTSSSDSSASQGPNSQGNNNGSSSAAAASAAAAAAAAAASSSNTGSGSSAQTSKSGTGSGSGSGSSGTGSSSSSTGSSAASTAAAAAASGASGSSGSASDSSSTSSSDNSASQGPNSQGNNNGSSSSAAAASAAAAASSSNTGSGSSAQTSKSGTGSGSGSGSSGTGSSSSSTGSSASTAAASGCFKIATTRSTSRTSKGQGSFVLYKQGRKEVGYIMELSDTAKAEVTQIVKDLISEFTTTLLPTLQSRSEETNTTQQQPSMANGSLINTSFMPDTTQAAPNPVRRNLFSCGSPPKFSGKQSEAAAWLRKYEQTCVLNGLTGDELLHGVGWCLDGMASDWFWGRIVNQNRTLTWVEFRAEFCSTFINDEEKSRLLNSICTKIQKPDESLSSYVYSMLSMCSEYDPSMEESNLINYMTQVGPQGLQGLFEFTRMPFGLKNAPATAVRTINGILGGLNYVDCFVYFDDIIIFGRTQEEHDYRLRLVLQRLKQHDVKLRRHKCTFSVNEIIYLGHKVNQDGIVPDPSRAASILCIQPPTNIHEMRRFLGLATTYRRFIDGFSRRAFHLNRLLKKNVPYVWTEDQQNAFDDLKQALVSPPVLSPITDEGEIELRTDASNEGLGACLLQKQNDEFKPISFISRTLNPAEKNYGVTEKECLAIVWAIANLRHYLFGRKFTVITDHCGLCCFRSVKDPTVINMKGPARTQVVHVERLKPFTTRS